MPGIIGIIGEKANTATLDKMCEKLNHCTYCIESHYQPGIGLARVHIGHVNTQPQPVMSTDKRYLCILIGEIFCIDGVYPIENETVVFLDRFINQGIKMLSSVNGQYSACIVDLAEKTVYLISDKWGSRPVYYTVDGQTLYFAPEVKALLVAGINKTINYPAFSDMFHFGHLFGFKTFFEGVEQLPDASVLTFKHEHISIKTYWDYPFNEASYSEAKLSGSKYKEQKEELKVVLENAIKRQTAKNSEKLLIPLSGGLDSRFVAALSHKCVGENVNTFTMGEAKSEDQKYGAEVARQLRFPHEAFNTKSEDIWETASFFNYISDAMPQIYGPIAIDVPCRHYRHSCEIVLAPQMCDALFGSMLSRKGVKMLRENPSRKEANTILTDFYNTINEEYLQVIFDKDFYQKYIQGHWKTVPQQYITQYRHPLHCYFMLLYKEHVRRATLSGNLIYNLYYDARMPSYDNDLIDLAFGIPLPFKINQNIYRFAFAELFPALARIKRQGTHLPIDAPGYMIDALRLCDKFLIKAKSIPVIEKTSNRLTPPSYTNFNQWFKFELRDKLHNLLLDQKTLDRGIFDKNGVEAILRLHDKSTEDHSRLLWQMVNLEYFFRYFID